MKYQNYPAQICRVLPLLALCAVAAGCGGGSAGSTAMSGPSVPMATVTRAYPSSGGAIDVPTVSGFSGTLDVPQPTATIPDTTNITVSTFAGAAPNTPALPSADSILTGPGSTTPVFAVTYTLSAPVPTNPKGNSSAKFPGATITVPLSDLPANVAASSMAAQAGLFIPASGSTQVATLICNLAVTQSGATITYTGPPNSAPLQSGSTYTIEFYIASAAPAG